MLGIFVPLRLTKSKVQLWELWVVQVVNVVLYLHTGGSTYLPWHCVVILGRWIYYIFRHSHELGKSSKEVFLLQ